jgi:hypothetical protein
MDLDYGVGRLRFKPTTKSSVTEIRVAEQTLNSLLFSTKKRVAAVLAFTGLSLYLDINPISSPLVPPSPWLLDLSFLSVHGWTLLAVNIAVFAFVCWIAFHFILGSYGLARTFVVAWAVPLMNWPLGFIASTHNIRHTISVVATSIAFLAALAMLLRLVHTNDRF